MEWSMANDDDELAAVSSIVRIYGDKCEQNRRQRVDIAGLTTVRNNRLAFACRIYSRRANKVIFDPARVVLAGVATATATTRHETNWCHMR